MNVSVPRRLFLILLLALVAPASWGQQSAFDSRSLAPYVPSPPRVVERMLELADVKESDTVYDLGSGDGRIIIAAAQQFGARAVGVELDSELVKKSGSQIQELRIDDRAKVVHGHLLDVDLTPASVVTLYLLTSSNLKLKPKLERDLKPGSRVVSHDFQIMGWSPVKTETVEGTLRTHTIYLYEIGKH